MSTTHFAAAIGSARLSELEAQLSTLTVLPKGSLNGESELYYEGNGWDLFFEAGDDAEEPGKFMVLLSGMSERPEPEALELAQKLVQHLHELGYQFQFEYYVEHPDGAEFEEVITLH